jgi:hypothetical protein
LKVKEKRIGKDEGDHAKDQSLAMLWPVGDLMSTPSWHRNRGDPVATEMLWGGNLRADQLELAGADAQLMDAERGNDDPEDGEDSEGNAEKHRSPGLRHAHAPEVNGKGESGWTGRDRLCLHGNQPCREK